MRRRVRIALGLVGIAVFSLAVLVVAVPAVGDAIPSDALVDAVGSDYVLAAAVGILATVLVVAVVALRGLDGIDQATMPEPETVQHASYPGVRFDRTVTERIHLLPHRPTEEEKRLRDRIRRAAERAVMRRENVSRERADAMVESGEWTDDATAAAFVSDSRRPPLRARFAALLTHRSLFQRGARRAAEEVSRLDGREAGSRSDAAGVAAETASATNAADAADAANAPNAANAANAANASGGAR
ncbi:DUF7269 family protein [Halopelagius fulvigenes]|uniref:Uncharacterized protein n=1 Tax=Halopelagius fulvigenes TaxID=1198324 RepID=A0ABD5U8X9_9EURY